MHSLGAIREGLEYVSAATQAIPYLACFMQTALAYRLTLARIGQAMAFSTGEEPPGEINFRALPTTGRDGAQEPRSLPPEPTPCPDYLHPLYRRPKFDKPTGRSSQQEKLVIAADHQHLTEILTHPCPR